MYGGVMQTFATTAGTSYVVTFDLGLRRRLRAL